MEKLPSHAYGRMLTASEKIEEEIFLGFRKTSGIELKKFKEKFGIEFEKEYKDILVKYKDYINKTPEGYALNLNGILLSNIILAEFLS